MVPSRLSLMSDIEEEDQQWSEFMYATSWKTMQRVQESGALEQLNETDIKLNEAKFEFLTSEVKYLNNLNILERHFMKNIQLGNILSEDDLRTLFGYVGKMVQSSKKFLSDMHLLWEGDIFLGNLLSLLEKHILDMPTFRNYIDYSNQYPKQVGCLNNLRRNHSTLNIFLDALKCHVFSQRRCIEGFLAQPVQRVIRLPVLMESLVNCMDEDHPDYDKSCVLLETLKKLSEECKSRMEVSGNREIMSEISRRLRVPQGMAPIHLVNDKRRFVNQTTVRKLDLDGWASLRKQHMEIFLFDDLVVFAKDATPRGKSEKEFIVTNYCDISSLQVVVPRAEGGYPGSALLTIPDNQKGNVIDMMIYFESSNRDQWTSLVDSLQNPQPTLYIATKNYPKTRKKDLQLSIGDMIIDVKDAPFHGYLQGKKLETGDIGYFPEDSVSKLKKPEADVKNKLKKVERRHTVGSGDFSGREETTVRTNEKSVFYL